MGKYSFSEQNGPSEGTYRVRINLPLPKKDGSEEPFSGGKAVRGGPWEFTIEIKQDLADGADFNITEAEE